MVDIRAYNREAWNREVENGNPWSQPVGPEVIAAARRGEWGIHLTGTKHTPRDWFPPLQGKEVLCLASGGGQQGPVLAAAGARVTVFDNSPAMLARDRQVAEREGLVLRLEEGDMRDLSRFADASFDLIFHPVSNVFIPDLQPVWNEAFRVLRPGASLLSGFMNPVLYLFDMDGMDRGEYILTHKVPYSDLEDLPQDKLEEYMGKGWPLEWSHTLEEQIGGQLQAGFLLAGFFEDGDQAHGLSQFTPIYCATRAVKPG